MYRHVKNVFKYILWKTHLYAFVLVVMPHVWYISLKYNHFSLTFPMWSIVCWDPQVKSFIVDLKIVSELNSVSQKSPVFTPRFKFSF